MLMDLIFGKPRVAAVNETWSPSGVQDFYYGNPTSASSVNVTPTTALSCPAWFRGLELISSKVASLPVNVYKIEAKKKADVDTQHPANWLLHGKANDRQTSYDWLRQMVGHALSRGTGYSIIDRSGDGVTPQALIPMVPEQVRPYRATDGNLWYEYTPSGLPAQRLPHWDVFRVMGLSDDGIVGHNVIAWAREHIGADIASTRWNATLYRNRATPAVVLQTEQSIPEPVAIARINAWNQVHQGIDSAHKTALLDRGLEAKALSFSPTDMAYIQNNALVGRAIGMFLGIPSHKLGDTSKMGGGSVEQENLSFLGDCLDSWLCKIEWEGWDKLLTEDEKRSRSRRVSFDRAQLMRADTAAMGMYYRTALAGQPWMTQNEVRGDNGMPPLDGGDELLQPLNMNGASDPGGDPRQTKDGSLPDTGTGDQRGKDNNALADNIVRLMAIDAGMRVASRVLHQAKAKAAKPREFGEWVESIEHDTIGARAAFAAVESAAALTGQVVRPGALAGAVLASAKAAYDTCLDAPSKQLPDAVDQAAKDLTVRIEKLCAEWRP